LWSEVRDADRKRRDADPGPVACYAIGLPGVPVWSESDGKKIAVGTTNKGTYVMRADETHLRRITKQGAAGATGASLDVVVCSDTNFLPHSLPN
jgi:hypothetical protein